MAFETPTLDEQIAFTVAHFAALFPQDDVSALSFNFLWCVCLAAAVTDNHAHLDATKNDLIPDTSEGASLDRWAAIRGVTRKSATPARRSAAFRASGIATTAIPALTELVDDASTLRFRITAGDVVGPGGYVDLDIAAIDVGSKTRISAKTVLRFTTPIANVEELGELQLELDEDGEDQELDGALRLRVLSRFATPPLGGAQEDYVQWALAVTGWATAFAYPIRAGLGTVDLAALHAGSNSARIPGAPEVAELQAALDELRPVSVKQFRVLRVEGEETTIEYTVVPNGEAQNAFDWDDAVPPVVGAWDGALRKVTLGADRPASMKAGDRVSFKNLAGAGNGRQRVIESLSSTDAFILEDDATADIPAATDIVYSGGPLVEPVRAAIQALIDSLGTANSDSARYGAWEGSLRASAIGRVATSVKGVLDGTVVAPVATVDASDPVYPDDGQIGLLIAGRLLVRCQH